jgi:hypothetical protein
MLKVFQRPGKHGNCHLKMKTKRGVGDNCNVCQNEGKLSTICASYFQKPKLHDLILFKFSVVRKLWIYLWNSEECSSRIP